MSGHSGKHARNTVDVIVMKVISPIAAVTLGAGLLVLVFITLNRAQNAERELRIANQNLLAAVDSTQRVWEDSARGIAEHARIAFASKQGELERIVEDFSRQKRRFEGRISTLTLTVASLRERIDGIPTTVTHDTVHVGGNAGAGAIGVVKMDWKWLETHGRSRLYLQGQCRYFPEPDSGSTDVDSLLLDLALLARTSRSDDGTIQTLVTSDWPGLVPRVESHVDQDLFYPKASFWKKAWGGIRLGGAFLAGVGVCRVAG